MKADSVQTSWVQAQKRRVYQSKNWREFVESYWVLRNKNDRKINYAELSRRCKYSSRAHIYELLTGKKKISAPVVVRLSEALRLKSTEKRLFALLAEKETSSKVTKALDDSIKVLAAKLILQTQINDSEIKMTEVFSGYHVFSIYAALGSPEKGASLAELKSSTNINENLILTALEKFIATGCVEKNKDRYFLTTVSLDLVNLGANLNFKEAFLRALDQIKPRAQRMEFFGSDLYFHTAIPIRKGTQKLLKERLRECIIDFIDKNDGGIGDEIVHINLSAYKD